jgi:hypothetical protein
MIILTLMYAGLFYMTADLGTGYGKTGKDEKRNAAYNFILFPILLIPNVFFFLNWMRIIVLNLLILVHQKNVKIFRIITLNLWDEEQFYHKFID